MKAAFNYPILDTYTEAAAFREITFPELLEEIMHDLVNKLRPDHIIGLWRSVGGKGLCCVYIAEPQENESTEDYHKTRYEALSDYIEVFKITVPKGQQNIGRVRFQSFDSKGFFNPDTSFISSSSLQERRSQERAVG